MKEKVSPTKQSSSRDDPDWAYDTVDFIKHIIQELILGQIRSESPIVLKSYLWGSLLRSGIKFQDIPIKRGPALRLSRIHHERRVENPKLLISGREASV